jgi:flagellar biogenesis protein FliO
MELNVSDLIQLIAILGIITAVVYGVLKFVQDFTEYKKGRRY